MSRSGNPWWTRVDRQSLLKSGRPLPRPPHGYGCGDLENSLILALQGRNNASKHKSMNNVAGQETYDPMGITR